MEALLIAKSTKDAAQLSGVGLRTLARWLSEPDFQAAYAAARADALQRVTDRLVMLLAKSLDVLESDLAGNDATRAQRAALGILARVADLRQHLDTEARLTVLEQAAQGAHND
jgi:hypothetical protein